MLGIVFRALEGHEHRVFSRVWWQVFPVHTLAVHHDHCFLFAGVRGNGWRVNRGL